jgi:uncharacterized protein YdhG (YjbR/CyaY superfamily)
MEVFAEYLANIENPQNRARTEEVLAWVANRFPTLKPRIAWNQPMFTDHGTYIIGFSVANHHIAIGPERAGIIHFSSEIIKAGYDHGKMLMRIPWESPVDYSLLERIIEYNISEKAGCSTFWRK